LSAPRMPMLDPALRFAYGNHLVDLC
jgi:hypothetical protein